MAMLVGMGANLICSFGTAPSSLVITPENRVNGKNMSAATIMDYVPMKNIMPFLLCTTPSNPQVASATAAASGVLTPQPCIPVIVAPWKPGSPTVMIGKKPALTNTCTAQCNWGGVISITAPGVVSVNAQ